jgi:hypothetical protein
MTELEKRCFKEIDAYRYALSFDPVCQKTSMGDRCCCQECAFPRMDKLMEDLRSEKEKEDKSKHLIDKQEMRIVGLSPEVLDFVKSKAFQQRA